MTMDAQTTMTQAEFARHLGRNKSYVTRLKQAGRLVMAGRQVAVEASLEKIRGTASPERDQVAARFAEPGDDQRVPLGPDGGSQPTGSDVTTYQTARAKKEHYLALQAEADYRQNIGELLEADQVRFVAADAGARLRSMLERLPDRLADELAAIDDPQRVRALLVENIEETLHEVADSFEALARERV